MQNGGYTVAWKAHVKNARKNITLSCQTKHVQFGTFWGIIFDLVLDVFRIISYDSYATCVIPYNLYRGSNTVGVRSDRLTVNLGRHTPKIVMHGPVYLVLCIVCSIVIWGTVYVLSNSWFWNTMVIFFNHYNYS